jgi:hypothetical protein
MPVVLPVIDGAGSLRALKFVQVVVSTTVIGFDIPPGVSPRRVIVSIHTNAIRIRWDGGDPTPAVGHQLAAGGGPAADASRGFELLGAEAIRNFRMCRYGASDAEVAYTIEV